MRTRFANPALGCDLLLDERRDLALTCHGDLALTPSGRATLIQDVRNLLDTLPGDLFGYPDYGAGLMRLAGESDGASFAPAVLRAMTDALTYDAAVGPRIDPDSISARQLPAPAPRSCAFEVSFTPLGETLTTTLNYVFGDNATTEVV